MKTVLVIIAILAVICLVISIVDTHRFVVRRYTITSSKVHRDIRFVMLADLHNKVYGDHNAPLLRAIDDEAPEAILIAGDMPDGIAGHDHSPASEFVRALASKYQIYYGLGNHEYRLKIYPDQYGTMWEDYHEAISVPGVHLLDNDRIRLDECGIDIAGVSIDKSFYRRFKRSRMTEDVMKVYLGDASEDAFQLLIAHDPEYFKAYSAWGADLTVSGHVHGGIMRLPLVGGIVSPRLIAFPKYSDGEYTDRGHSMIVSCGLGTHTIHVRVFNPAELSVIDIKKENS